jgi:hypothetical protein
LLGGGTGGPGTAVSQPDPARDASRSHSYNSSVRTRRYAEDLTQILPQQTNTPYRHASWCFSAITLSPDAAAPRRPRALSIVQAMSAFTSI